jgi:CBS domain-containing protein
MYTVKHLLEGKGRQLFSVAPGDSVLRAIEVMAERHVGALLVLDRGELAGIISERDYARKVILKGRSSADTKVAEIMTTELVTVAPRDSVHRCMSLMTDKRIRHLPVLDGGKVVGVLSIGDLVKAVIDEQQHKIEDLERYIAG